MKNNIYFCYTDGSCKKVKDSPGGWGVFIKCPDGTEVERYSGAIKTTTSTMELTAIFHALSALPEGAHAVIFSDSQSALDYCSKSIPIWEKNGWKSVTAENPELLKSISTQLREKKPTIEWKWIRGHNGNQGNERADELAAKGAREAKAKLT